MHGNEASLVEKTEASLVQCDNVSFLTDVVNTWTAIMSLLLTHAFILKVSSQKNQQPTAAQKKPAKKKKNVGSLSEISLKAAYSQPQSVSFTKKRKQETTAQSELKTANVGTTLRKAAKKTKQVGTLCHKLCTKFYCKGM